MERSEIRAAMSTLKLHGMKAAFDEIITTAVKRQHEPQHIVGDLLAAEINEKQARSIRYQLTIATLPLVKEISEFQFGDTPINETLVCDLAGSNFLDHQCNVVLVCGTGTGKTHLAIAMARALIRDGKQGRFSTSFGDRHHQPGARLMAQRIRRCQDDDHIARPADPPLRHRRDRQRRLAVQKPRLTHIASPLAPVGPQARRARRCVCL